MILCNFVSNRDEERRCIAVRQNGRCYLVQTFVSELDNLVSWVFVHAGRDVCPSVLSAKGAVRRDIIRLDLKIQGFLE